MMLTTTTNNTNTTNSNTTAQQQRTATKMRTPEQEERLRDRWENRVHCALFRRMKRNVRAANALFWTPEWVEPDIRYFTASETREVTRHAALVEECLDDARARAKRKGRALPPLEYLPCGILESAAMEPYLKRWKRDNDLATRAHCAYPLMD
jgi:hypothetical protein